MRSPFSPSPWTAGVCVLCAGPVLAQHTQYGAESTAYAPDAAGSGTLASVVLSLADDSFASVSLPFPFTFYEGVHTTLFVSSNGYLSFVEGSAVTVPPPIPDPSPPNNFIAAWWEDLDPSAGAAAVRYDAYVDRVAVTFSDVEHAGGGNPVTFQVKLFADRTIEMHYTAAPSDGGLHTVGVENHDGFSGTEYFRGNSGLPPASALLFVPITTSVGDGVEATSWGRGRVRFR